jgi:hypothetical protein
MARVCVASLAIVVAIVACQEPSRSSGRRALPAAAGPAAFGVFPAGRRSPPGGWLDPQCQVHRACISAAILPEACSENMGAVSVDAAVHNADGLWGHDVRVRGFVRVLEPSCSLLACSVGESCCNSCVSDLVLAGAVSPDERLAWSADVKNSTILIPLQGCVGDESGLCCSIKAGSEVVVTGRLVRTIRSDVRGEPHAIERRRPWPYVLEAQPGQAPAVCSDASPSGQ